MDFDIMATWQQFYNGVYHSVRLSRTVWSQCTCSTDRQTGSQHDDNMPGGQRAEWNAIGFRRLSRSQTRSSDDECCFHWSGTRDAVSSICNAFALEERRRVRNPSPPTTNRSTSLHWRKRTSNIHTRPSVALVRCFIYRLNILSEVWKQTSKPKGKGCCVGCNAAELDERISRWKTRQRKHVILL